MALNSISVNVLGTLESMLLIPAEEIVEGWEQVRNEQYRSWRVWKGQGRSRRIDAPLDGLKTFQRHILEQVLYRLPISPLAHGFVPGRSIVTNARVHAGTAQGMLSLDLENAFPSVSRSRVRHMLEWAYGWTLKTSYPGLSDADRDELFDVLAEACCYRGCLPQGAPTSGMLLNLCCAGLDRRFARLVRQLRSTIPDLRYSRYADDLTFTSSQPIPQSFRRRALQTVRMEGFRVNSRKIKQYTARNADLVICGIRLHERNLTIPRKLLRRYKSLFFQSLAYDPQETPPEVKSHIRGAIGFITMVSPLCPAPILQAFRAMVSHHRSWLHPETSIRDRSNLPPYGVG